MESCVANWPLILEYLKAFLSWPPMAVGFLVFVFLSYRPEIRKLINRIKGLEGFGGKLDASLAEQQATSEGTIPSPPPEAVTVKAQGQPPSTKFGTPTAIQGSPSPQQPIDAVSSNPVTAKAEILKWWSIAKFESVFNVIFGTQLRMLVALSQQPVTGELLSNLLPFHLEHQTVAGAAAVPLGNFFSFLITNQLMRLEGEGATQKAYITEIGQQFLGHIIRTYGTFASNRPF